MNPVQLYHQLSTIRFQCNKEEAHIQHEGNHFESFFIILEANA